MDKQKTTLQRYKPVLIAALYLLIFALGVLYLRATVNVPAEGDDRLTLNGWMFRFENMPFYQYLLADLRDRLDYFLLRQLRFFPFHYPSAFALLFYHTLASYRLYIIAMTGAAAFLVSRVTARLCRNDALALGSFALALALMPLYNEGMYSYYAVPQRTLLWAAAAWLCALQWQGTHHRRWAVAAGVFAFISCGTYELGYVFTVLALLMCLIYRRSLADGLRTAAPLLGGTGVALVFHLLSSRGGGAGNTLSLNLPQVGRVLVQQMAASIPFLAPLLQEQDCGVITKGDMIWPFLLGLVAAICVLFLAPRQKTSGKTLGGIALFGLGLWAFPAALLALSARYQAPEAICWKWGYIPAAASSVGMALLLAAALAALSRLFGHLPKISAGLLRGILSVALAAALCANGAFVRGCLRTHHAENLKVYNFFSDSIRSGLADEVTSSDLILCNENVWDGNSDAETNFFSRFAARELHAQMLGLPVPDDFTGTLYSFQTYRNYGGHDLAWCGRAMDSTAELLDGVRVYVQSAYVPDNAVIKYKVRLPDGSEEARQICLLDCDRTERKPNGDYIATVEDSCIINAKIMIWDG